MTHLDKASAEKQLTEFVNKFEPKHRSLIRAVRKVLRSRFPTAYELAYDNYNFFVIGYSPTERPSDAIVSLVAGANGVSLCFFRGATLRDPKRVLLGSGKQTRFLRLDSAGTLGRAEVKALLAAAAAQARTPLRATGRGTLIIRSVSAKQRPRRRDPKHDSTATFTVSQHFVNRAANVRATYGAIIAAARAMGPVREEPKKTSIHLARKTAFAGVATRRAALILTLKSATDISSPRIRQHEQASAHRWHLEVELVAPRDVDRELRGWLKRAYALAG